MRKKRSFIETLVGDFMAGSDPQTLALLEIIGNQQLAISRLADMLSNVPGVDKDELNQTISELENFMPSQLR